MGGAGARGLSLNGTRRVMNYLAHAFLAGAEADAIAGALLGDFVKGTQTDFYPPAIRTAILLHRAIDRYTDRHPVVVASRGIISAPRRRFAGVMIDMFYDHFLARHWSRFSAEPLQAFTARVYVALAKHAPTAPERLRRMLPQMQADDWLASYAELDAIDAAIDGIARRLKRTNNLGGGGEELRRNYEAIESGFSIFFPQLQRHVLMLTRAQEAHVA